MGVNEEAKMSIIYHPDSSPLASPSSIMTGFQTRIARTHHESSSSSPQNRGKNKKTCRECGGPKRQQQQQRPDFDPESDQEEDEEDPFYLSVKIKKSNDLTSATTNCDFENQQKFTSHLHLPQLAQEPVWCNRNFNAEEDDYYYSNNNKNNIVLTHSPSSSTSSSIPSDSSKRRGSSSEITATATVIFKVSVSTSPEPSGVSGLVGGDKMPTTMKQQQQDPAESRNNGGNVTILNAGNLDRDRDHLISINTNNSDLHKQTIRVKNMPSSSSSSSQNHGQCGGGGGSDNNFDNDFNNVSPNITTVSTNPADRIVLQIHSSSSSSNNNNNSSSGIRVHNNNNFNNTNSYASTVNPNVNFRKTLNNIESDNNLGAISTVYHHSNNYHTDNYVNDKCSPTSVYPDSDIIFSSSRTSSTRSGSGTGLIQNDDDDDDDYLPTSLPHSIDDIINTNSNNNTNTKMMTTAEVFANSIAYPTTAKSNPHCPNCNGVVPLSHLETISETAASKIEHGFWNHNYNNLHTNLHRESSFHSYGGFTLNGQPGYLKPNKHKIRRFCSSHKVAFVVSTFSLLVTIGLIITLLLMKKKGMMEAM